MCFVRASVKVMVALRNADRHDECLECWRELVLLDGLGDVKVNDKTYNLALRSTAKAGRWEEMGAVLDMMQVCDADTLHTPASARLCATVCCVFLVLVRAGRNGVLYRASFIAAVSYSDSEQPRHIFIYTLYSKYHTPPRVVIHGCC